MYEFHIFTNVDLIIIITIIIIIFLFTTFISISRSLNTFKQLYYSFKNRFCPALFLHEEAYSLIYFSVFLVQQGAEMMEIQALAMPPQERGS